MDVVRRYVLVAVCVAVVSCGGSNAEHSGQGALIEKTFAGANKCNPKNHERPFIIEWDATDQSSFQARASSDIVFVKYEGCDLTILDGCSMDSVTGAFGSYKPVNWTTGQLESLDITNESDLFAKLPLGAAALAGRVQHGEKFHMEYYVSGTRSATREHAYRSALAKVPGCAGATHFVYAYNLGAFALGSQSNLKGEVGGSYFGFGAGGSRSSNTKADKRGGSLASCSSESAREIDGCKAPIRLTLREIRQGDDPQAVATLAPETDHAANLAGQLKSEVDRGKEASLHLDNAETKQSSRDGQGCIAELDAHDRLDPAPATLSTNPKSGVTALIRAACLMLRGQCQAGKQLFRKGAEIHWPDKGSDYRDAALDKAAGTYCQGDDMTPEDRSLQAHWTCIRGGEGQPGVDAGACRKAYSTWKDLGLIHDRRPADPGAALAEHERIESVMQCIRTVGDCADLYGACVNNLMFSWGSEEAFHKRNPFSTFRSTCDKEVAECKAQRSNTPVASKAPELPDVISRPRELPETPTSELPKDLNDARVGREWTKEFPRDVRIEGEVRPVPAWFSKGQFAEEQNRMFARLGGGANAVAVLVLRADGSEYVLPVAAKQPLGCAPQGNDPPRARVLGRYIEFAGAHWRASMLRASSWECAPPPPSSSTAAPDAAPTAAKPTGRAPSPSAPPSTKNDDPMDHL